VVKSFIGVVGTRIGTAPCAGAGASVPQALLNLFAKATDASFSENPLDDALVATKEPPTKQYRLYSQCLISVVHDGRRISSVVAADFRTDVGRETLPDVDIPAGQPQYIYMQPPPMVVVAAPSFNPTGSNLWTFSWETKGRPPVEVEPVFNQICPRTSVYIWHRISGEINLSGRDDASNIPRVERLELTGSQFPSHRAFVNGAVSTTVWQGPLSSIWTPDPSDPTKVR